MNHAMADAKHSRSAILGPQPRRERFDGLIPVAYRDILVCKTVTIRILN
jgi:hypothetical protein